jgi:hypothetical protein
MRSFILLIILILLEIFIIPTYRLRDTHKILSRSTIHFLGILNSVYSTRVTLKEYRCIAIIVIAINFLFGKFLISQFYDYGCKYFDSMHSIAILLITIIPFIIFTSQKEILEFEEHGGLIKSFIHQGFSNIISVNQLFYFYKNFHLKYGNIVEYYFNKQLIIHFIVDFLANSFSYTVNNLLGFYMHRTKEGGGDAKYLKGILKKFMLMVLANLAFYSIYSFQMARKVFEGFNLNLPQPHNLILYNMLPQDLDQRFRVFLYIFNWLIV